MRVHWFEGMRRDLLGRLPHYLDDWTHPFSSLRTLSKVIASVVFMFFSSTIPAITFAAFLITATNNQYGVVEVLLSTAIAGVAWSILAGQPLVIIGVTGPVSIFSRTIYQLTSQYFNIPFLPFMFWIAFWSGLMHMALAAMNACDFIHLFTRFSCENFDLIIAVIYIYTGVSNLVDVFRTKTIQESLLSLILALSTFYIAHLLASARHSIIFNRTIRDLLADYALPVSVTLLSTLRLAPPTQDVPVSLLQVPSTFRPSDGRSSWLVNVTDVPVWAVFLAIIPAIVLTILFFFDHNVSSLLAQTHKYNLKKPSSYNLDFFLEGTLLICTSLIGIPFYNALIPQAPLHTRSLAHIREEEFEDEITGRTLKREVVTHVEEQRLSNFLQSFLCFLCVLPGILQILGGIPTAVLSGLFLYMGSTSFKGNSLVERVLVILFVFSEKHRSRMAPHSWPAIRAAKVPFRKVVLFTAVQVVFVVVVIIIMESVAALAFPIFILLMLPTRSYLIPSVKLFGPLAPTSRELNALDGGEEDFDDSKPVEAELSQMELTRVSEKSSQVFGECEAEDLEGDEQRAEV